MFIELTTSADGEPVLINMDDVTCIFPTDDSTCVVRMRGTQGWRRQPNILIVSENIPHIRKLIGGP